MKTAELTGADLDAAVALALGWERVPAGWMEPTPDGCGIGHSTFGFKPSTDWAKGGPIIERERIMLMPFGDDYYRATIGVVGHPMCGDPIPAYDETYSATGHTPLIAAMRAFVSSQFGEDVDAKA